MAVMRYLVHEVEPAISYYTQPVGFTLVERMGPAFAIVARGDLKLWRSGPQSSAARRMPDGRQSVAEDPSGNPLELFQPA